MSEGGLIAGLLASYSPDVEEVALVSYGGGMSMRETWPLAKASILRKQNIPENTVREEVVKIEAMLKVVTRFGYPYSNYDGDTNTWLWWRTMLDKHLVNTILNTNANVLLVHGGRDEMVPIASAQKLHNLLNEKHRESTFIKCPRLNHSLGDEMGKPLATKILSAAFRFELVAKEYPSECIIDDF